VFSLTVRSHFMIAHSLPREAFGPAQGLHGATFVAEVTFRRRALNEDAIVLDIGEAGKVLGAVLEGLNYKNLDEHPDFAGKLSTTEALAQYIAGAVAAEIRGGEDGRELAGLEVTLREHPDAWANYSLDFDAIDVNAN
jgi:6-pyruvoyltetrahydropterin/6-carboxytetrahydropterin synthase